ncbi:hypothetical protein GMDG_01513 [Pseudogymnoascus destructans 20631-21]|uniref:Uncharacterized protein n=1 Tax=Pseudogymnoascus destructans (strain ATCC MYA-4855 / 20631-21) TaxID=658429 RepID=L8FU70_PSED2|nr:hypothetical protein GMDG_01513 [Pseudogymnoascus destructans 20631-21]
MASLAGLSVPSDKAEFLNLDALVRALDDWAVKGKFSFWTEKREATKASFICAEKEDGSLVMGPTIIEPEHSCIGRGVRKSASSSKKAWLDPVVSRHLNVTTKTTPKEIRDLLRIRFAEEIDYKRAQECCLRLLDGDIGAQRHSFQLCRAYKELLERKSRGAHVDLLQDIHMRFKRIFARFILTLLLAVGIDANGELVPLAWAVVESENGESWGWFLNHLRLALPELVIEESTLVSDRDKGLREAERGLGGSTGEERAAWDGALEKIRAKKLEAALYLETWAEAWFRGRRFGHDTSNIAEILNQVLRIDRELPIVELLDAIWHRVMEKRGQRLLAATSAITEGRLTTPFVDARIEEGRELARSNRVQISSPTTGRVVQPDGTIYLVDTAAGICPCRCINEVLAITLIFAGGGQLAPFLPVTMSAAQWAAAYVVPLTPIDISELEVNAQDPIAVDLDGEILLLSALAAEPAARQGTMPGAVASLINEDVVEMWTVKVTNPSGRPRKISVYPYFPFGNMSWMNQSAEYRPDLGAVVGTSITPYQKAEDYFKNKLLKDKSYFLCGTPPNSWETTQKVFEGEGGLHAPSAVMKPGLGGGDARYETPAAAVQYRETLEADDQREYRFLFGPALDDAEIRSMPRPRWRDARQRKKMLPQVDEQLSTTYGVLIFAPPFSGMREDVGRLTQKRARSAENGSVYNQAAVFYIYSLYGIGEKDRAYKLLREMIPGPTEEDYLQRGQLPVFIPNYYRGAWKDFLRTAGRSSQLFNTDGHGVVGITLLPRACGVCVVMQSVRVVNLREGIVFCKHNRST